MLVRDAKVLAVGRRHIAGPEALWRRQGRKRRKEVTLQETSRTSLQRKIKVGANGSGRKETGSDSATG